MQWNKMLYSKYVSRTPNYHNLNFRLISVKMDWATAILLDVAATLNWVDYADVQPMITFCKLKSNPKTLSTAFYISVVAIRTN